MDEKLNINNSFPFFYKEHPNILKINNTQRFNFNHFEVPNELPAELLIQKLLGLFKTVIVYHHGSSIVRYIQSDKILYKDLN